MSGFGGKVAVDSTYIYLFDGGVWLLAFFGQLWIGFVVWVYLLSCSFCLLSLEGFLDYS